MLASITKDGYFILGPMCFQPSVLFGEFLTNCLPSIILTFISTTSRNLRGTYRTARTLAGSTSLGTWEHCAASHTSMWRAWPSVGPLTFSAASDSTRKSWRVRWRSTTGGTAPALGLQMKKVWHAHIISTERLFTFNVLNSWFDFLTLSSLFFLFTFPQCSKKITGWNHFLKETSSLIFCSSPSF